MARINWNNPALQEQLVKLANKQGSRAARRRLIQRYAGAEGGRLMRLEQAGKDRALQERMFNDRLALARARLAQGRSELRDARRGNRLAFGLGLGQLGLGYLDYRRAQKEKEKESTFQRKYEDAMVEGYLDRNDARGITRLWPLFPEMFERSRITEGE